MGIKAGGQVPCQLVCSGSFSSLYSFYGGTKMQPRQFVHSVAELSSLVMLKSLNYKYKKKETKKLLVVFALPAQMNELWLWMITKKWVIDQECLCHRFLNYKEYYLWYLKINKIWLMIILLFSKKSSKRFWEWAGRSMLIFSLNLFRSTLVILNSAKGG